jgi:hypothetical protein
VNGFHSIRIFRVEKQEKTLIEISEDLFNHGYSWNNKKERHIISGEDFQILRDLKALNPDIIGNQVLKAKINPKILTYLRDSGKIIETISSEQLKFSNEPLITAVRLQHQPKRGIQIHAGLFVHNSTIMHFLSAFTENEINEYIKIGQLYYIKPNIKNNIVEEMLKKEKEIISLEKIPYFIKNNLPEIKNSFDHIELHGVENIVIYEDKVKPIVQLNIADKKWIDIRINFKIVDNIIAYDVLRKSEKEYLQINDYIWVNVDNLDLQSIEEKIKIVIEAREKDVIKTSITNFPRLAEILKHIDVTVEGLKEAASAYFDVTKITEIPPTPSVKKPPSPTIIIATKNEAPTEPPKVSSQRSVPTVSKHHIDSVIEKFLKAPSRNERETAENQLLEYGENAVIFLIKALYNTEEENIWKLISVLGKIGDVRAIEAYEKIWDKSNEEDKKFIITALSEIGDARGYNLLKRALKEKNIVLQIRAREAKEKIDKNYIGK